MAENRGRQGTGRHPHKSTEEPHPHTKEEGTTHGRSHDDGDSRGQSHGGGRDHDREMEDDLKRREYRGEDGQIHHHTRTYMEQHGHDRVGDSHGHAQGGDDRRHDDNRSHGRDDDRSDRRR